MWAAEAHAYLNALARRLREQPVPIEVLTVAAAHVSAGDPGTGKTA